MDSQPPVAQLADQLAEAFRAASAGHVVVVTGAGVSHASGIPTFRGEDPDAIWHRDVTELATYAFFSEDPAGSWSWYLRRFSSLDAAEPNQAHFALVALEDWQRQQGGELLLVTQNIDTLHESAGSRNLVKVHGSCDRVRCPRWGCRHAAPAGSLPRSRFDLGAFQADPLAGHLPRCPECGSLLRQHVLWFDESYGDHEDYQIERVLAAADRMQWLLFVGTSFSVGITELLLQAAGSRGIPVLSVDPAETSNIAPWHQVRRLLAPAEVLLPAVCDRIGVEVISSDDRE